MNNLHENIIFFWTWSTMYITNIAAGKKKTLHIYIKSFKSPGSIMFRAYTSEEQIPIQLNSKGSLELQPSNEEISIHIHQKGGNFNKSILFLC